MYGANPASVFSILASAGIAQRARLLRLDTPLGDTLVAERFTGTETVSALFSFDIDCLSAAADLDIATLLGKEITWQLLQADGSLRSWHGVVAAADTLGADGGLARYSLRVAPWLAMLDLRRDSFIYQDQDAMEILGEIFADYPLASFKFDVSRTLAKRAVCTQYRESDLAFVRRLMAEEGLSFRFDHSQGDDKDESSKGAHHQLVVFDAQAALPACPLSPIRFHRASATEAEDSIQQLSVRRNVQPNAVARSAWHDVALHAHAAEIASAHPAGDVPELQDYDAHGHGRYADAGQAERQAQDRLQYFEARQVRLKGLGTVRALAAGQTFVLSQHDRFGGAAQQNGENAGPKDSGDDRFTVLAVHHEAANNLGAEIAQLLARGEVEAGSYRNTFISQPQAAQVVPAWYPKPTAPEGVTALVVAADEAALTTGRDLRVKVQFGWQRGTAPVAGGLGHRTHADDQGNAPGNEKSGTWLRVATAFAGPNWGTHLLPRAGTEVLIDFLDGDIDQPVVAAQLYNDEDTPPWAAGEESDANHPGTLSGWHSHILDGNGHNQWLFDDATGQLRMRLSASTAASELGLGHLIEQDPKSSTRGAWRGLGFELRTDAWTVVRSGQAMLLSASASPQAGSAQADTSEALKRVRTAKEAAQRVSSAGQQRHALPLAANERFDPLVDALDPQGQGHYAESVNGQRATKAEGGERTGSAPVDRIADARIVIDAPHGLSFTSPASMSMFAGRNTHTTSLEDAHISATGTFAAAVGRAASIYVQEGGIKAIAGGAPLTVQAHTDALDLVAGQDITVTSSDDTIEILARKSITLKAAGAAIILDGGNILFQCPGLFSVKGSSHSFSGGERGYAALPALPSGLAAPNHREAFRLLDQTSGEPLAGLPYFIELADGDFVHGVTDDKGHTEVAATDAPQIARCYVGLEARKRVAQVA